MIKIKDANVEIRIDEFGMGTIKIETASGEGFEGSVVGMTMIVTQKAARMVDCVTYTRQQIPEEENENQTSGLRIP